MKILVIQLARLGDILQTWPSLRALRRTYPDAEIHLLVRPRFQVAVKWIEEINAVWRWPTEEFFSDLLGHSARDPLEACLERVDTFIDTLASQKFTHVVNLTFSPLSSLLTEELSQGALDVRGYTRTEDGHLAIPDDASAYFYAQVGPGRANRLHLMDIFASVVGVDLRAEDQRITRSYGEADRGVKALPYGVVHVGASEGHKTYPAYKWKSVLKALERETSLEWILIGSGNEVHLGSEIVGDGALQRTRSMVGCTQFGDLFKVIHQAVVLIGGDSAPIHIASLVNCPTINISFGSVNFWETGPRADRARVIWSECPELLASDRVALEVIKFLRGDHPGEQTYEYDGTPPTGYKSLSSDASSEFTWNLIQAIYLGGDWPYLEDEDIYHSLVRLREAIDFCIDQVQVLKKNPQNRQSLALLGQADTVVEKIGQMNPAIRPLISWFNTERIRIKPGGLEEVAEKTLETYRNLILVLDLYGTSASRKHEGGRDGTMLDR